MGAGARHGGVGGGVELSRSRCRRSEHREISQRGRAGENLRPRAATEVRGRDFRARLREKIFRRAKINSLRARIFSLRPRAIRRKNSATRAALDALNITPFGSVHAY